MNELISVFLVIFLPIFLFIQIKKILRLMKRKKNQSNLVDVLFLSSGGECCLTVLEESLDAGSSSRRESDDHWEKKSTKAPKEYEIKVALEKKDKDLASLSEVEIIKLIELASTRSKTSLLYLSNITKIPIDIVIEILSQYPNLKIEDEYVINKETLEKEVLGIKINPKEIKEFAVGEEKIFSGICPDCNNTIENDSEYCPNCGAYLKD